MNNKIIILLILIVFIFIIIDCNCKEGFSIGGPDWVVVYGNKYVFDEEQILKDISIGDIVYSGDGKNYVVTADTRESALEEVRKGDLGTEPDGDEYDIIEYTDEMRDEEEEEEEVDASDTVPEPSPDFEFEDEEDEELANLYESGTLLGRCEVSENDIIKGECKFIKDLDNYVTIIKTIVEYVKPFVNVSDDPGIDHDWIYDKIHESIDDAHIRETLVNDRIATIEGKLSTLEEGSDDYKRLQEIIVEYTKKNEKIKEHRVLLESHRDEI